MGKKSKKAARAGVAKASAKPSRCDLCVSLIRKASNEVKCPGCDKTVCKRCEDKDFYRCPNADCQLPSWRCSDCVEGVTFGRLGAAEKGEEGPAPRQYGKLVHVSHQLAQELLKEKPAALPFLVCEEVQFCKEITCVLCYERGMEEAKRNKAHPPHLK